MNTVEMEALGRKQFWAHFRSPWAKAVLVMGVMVHLLGFLFFGIITDVSLESPPVDAFVQFTGETNRSGHLLFREQAMLFDSEPIFLPTQWNVTSRLVDSLRTIEAPNPFDPFKAERLLSREQHTAQRWNSEEVVEEITAVSVLYFENSQIFSSFGQLNRSVTPLPIRAASLEIRDLAGNRSVYSGSIEELSGLPVEEGELWSFLELTVIVDSLGQVGEPLIAQSTGKRELDEFLKSYLERILPEKNLNSGYFRVIFGP